MARSCVQTQQRLLDAAGAVFAARGFRQATVAEICRQARANIAAVNYHFGSKKKLYVEAWRHAHRQMLAAYPPDGGVPADAPPALRLRGRIRSLVYWACGSEDRAFRIVDREMAQPTGLIREVFRQSIAPLRQLTEQIVTQLLGPHADDRSVRLCALSVTAPCLHYLRHRRRGRHHGALGDEADLAPEELVDHFTAFALAGIEAVRRRLPAETGPGRREAAS